LDLIASPTNVIQFNEKLFQKTIKENRELKAKIEAILEVARANQRTQDHFEALERKILKSRSLPQMARTIAAEIKKRFNVEFVTLCLALDRGDILCRGVKGRHRVSCLRVIEPEELQRALPKKVRDPILRGRVAKGPSPFFSEEELSEIRSKAVVPLFLFNELIGTLNIGSRDPNRYTSDQGTEFLRRLGSKISLVIDNILAHQRLLELSITDPLTGISNRRHFDTALVKEVARSQRHGTPLACMAIDLDGFKEINDRFGHEAGDMALKQVAHSLSHSSRRYDVVARYGGDEFAVLLPHTPLKDAVRVAEKYGRQTKESPLIHQGREIGLRLSIGVAALPETEARNPQDLMKEADRCLYRAKNSGGGVVVSVVDP